MKKTPVWQKRFKRKINPSVLQFTSSIPDDAELVAYDIFCSLAHTEMLAKKKNNISFGLQYNKKWVEKDSF
ncbi:MAG: hypothetical protein ACUVQT_05450 [bacterium]